MFKKILISSIFLVNSVFAGEINIALAANVSYAINDLIAEFNKTNPDTKVQVTLGSSGKLTAQIKNGAPYDIFMAANMKFPQSLYDEEIAITEPIVYAQGALAMLSAKELDFEKGINLIDEKEIHRIAIANPKTAPYGTAALEAIKNANLLEKVENKFVFAESISQTVTYAVTAADLGFIAKSSLYSPKMEKYEKNINWIEVDPKLYTPINQGIVILKKAKNSKDAKAFYDFILNEKAKKIFKEFGYLVQ